jgi:hypothetical protein
VSWRGSPRRDTIVRRLALDHIGHKWLATAESSVCVRALTFDDLFRLERVPQLGDTVFLERTFEVVDGLEFASHGGGP